jgi:hypothetical protein
MKKETVTEPTKQEVIMGQLYEFFPYINPYITGYYDVSEKDITPTIPGFKARLPVTATGVWCLIKNHS